MTRGSSVRHFSVLLFSFSFWFICTGILGHGECLVCAANSWRCVRVLSHSDNVSYQLPSVFPLVVWKGPNLIGEVVAVFGGDA